MFPSWIKPLLAWFYIIDPTDSTIDAIKNALQGIMPYFYTLSVIELIAQTLLHHFQWFQRKGREPWRNYMLNDAFSSICAALLESQYMHFAMFLIPNISFVYEVRLFTLPESPSTWFLALFVHEFCYYWFHRYSHEINFLWCFHSVHHSAQDLQVLTGPRRHFLTANITTWFFIPAALLGLSPNVVLLHSVLNGAWQIWVHTQLIPKMHPIIEYVFNTPSHHRVHHGRNPYCLDKNYGGFLIIYDRLFGTFAEEREDTEPVVFGLSSKPLLTANPIVTQSQPLIDLVLKAYKTPGGLVNKFRSFIQRPKWHPDGPIEPPTVPNLIEEPHAIAKLVFEPKLPWTVRVYLVANTAALIVFQNMAFDNIALDNGNFSDLTMTYCSFSILSMLSMGMIWDGMQLYGFVSETARWYFVYRLATWYPDPLLPPFFYWWSSLCLVLSVVLWLAAVDFKGIVDVVASRWGYRKVVADEAQADVELAAELELNYAPARDYVAGEVDEFLEKMEQDASRERHTFVPEEESVVVESA